MDKEKLEKLLCGLADLFLEHYNPCGMDGKECMRGNGKGLSYQCCSGSPMYGGKDCSHSKPDRCDFPNIRCKVSFCWMAVEKMNSECRESFECLETLAKLYGFKKEPPWLGDIKLNDIKIIN